MKIPEIPDSALYIMSIIIPIIFIVILLTFGIYGIIVFVKHRKNKDEEIKLIAKKSMAQSFIIILILQCVNIVIKFISNTNYVNYEELTGIYIDPLGISFVIFGIVFVINDRKYRAKNKKTSDD